MCLKKNTVETIFLLQKVFRNEVLRVSMIKRWCKMFLYGRELVEFKPRSVKPKTMCTETNINTVANTIEEDHHISRESSTRATPLFTHCSQEHVLFVKNWHNSCYKTGYISVSKGDISFSVRLFST